MFRQLTIVLGVLLFIIALPVTLPVAMIQSVYTQHRRSKRATSFICLVCGKLLGPQSLERADHFWQNHVDSYSRSGMRLRVVQKVFAICECGQKYDYNEKSDDFELCEAAI